PIGCRLVPPARWRRRGWGSPGRSAPRPEAAGGLVAGGLGGWPPWQAGGSAGGVAAMSGWGDAAAGGHMVAVVVQQPLGELQDGRDPIIGQPVVHHPVVAAGIEEPAPAQAGQMVGDLWLGLGEPAAKLPRRQLPLRLEQPEDAQPGRVAEGAEVLGDQVGAGRSGWEAERGRLGHHFSSSASCDISIGESELSSSRGPAWLPRWSSAPAIPLKGHYWPRRSN